MMQMPHLMQLATAKFSDIMSDKIIQGFYCHTELLKVVVKVYSETTPAQHHLRKVCVDHLNTILHDFVKDPAYKQLCIKVPGFWRDFVQSQAESRESDANCSCCKLPLKRGPRGDLQNCEDKDCELADYDRKHAVERKDFIKGHSVAACPAACLAPMFL